MSNPFSTGPVAAENEAVGTVAVQEPETLTNTEAAPEELGEVDTPSESDEVDTVPQGATETKEKPAKAAKEPARPPVPEGYVSPVAFAKILSGHLSKKATEKAREADPNAEEVKIEIKPQMIYSYMKNAHPSTNSKNPWPRYSEGGRENLLKVEESLAWWDAKDARVASSKETQAAKAAKKAAKGTSEQAAAETGEVATGPVEEAE